MRENSAWSAARINLPLRNEQLRQPQKIPEDAVYSFRFIAERTRLLRPVAADAQMLRRMQNSISPENGTNTHLAEWGITHRHIHEKFRIFTIFNKT